MAQQQQVQKFIAGIRKFYKPVQPTVRQCGTQVTYSEFLPDPGLQDHIYCYWQLKSTKALEVPFSYCVVADGCIDIFFELQKPAESYVMGFCKTYTEFQLGCSFHYVGVRFLPSMFPQLFGTNASELSNRYESLSLVAPGTADFIKDNFYREQQPEEITRAFDACFLHHLAGMRFDYDPRFYRALSAILDKRGMTDVEKDLSKGISDRQLRRLFDYYIGTSPKAFSKVVRFQSILHLNPSLQNLKQNKLFFDLGYYDQAHFIKEFKTFYGITPGQAFER